MGSDSFKRWDGNTFKGQFLMSVFEVVAIGVSKNIHAIENLDNPKGYIRDKCVSLWNDETFQKNSGAGVRGTTRLSNLLPIAEQYFRP